MIRSTIKIDNYTFLCDLFLYDECQEKHRKSFYMLRNVYIDNDDNIRDSDIYFIDSELVTTDGNNTYISDDVIFPVPNKVLQFTTNINKFCEVTNPVFYKLFSLNDTENLSESDELPLKLIECHKVKIYHPGTKYIGNSIIYVDNMINDVHFHYFCTRYNALKNNSETEIKEFNTYYSEYVEFYLPNLIDLFSKDTVYIDNIISYSNTEKYTTLYNYNLPYIADKHNRTIITNADSEIGYSKYPYNISLVPFNNIVDDIYYNSDDATANSDVIIPENKLSFSANIDFNTAGQLVINSYFKYFDQTENIYSVYKYLNNIKTDKPEVDYPCVYILEISNDLEFKNIIVTSSNPMIKNLDDFYDDIGNYEDYIVTSEIKPVYAGFNKQEFSIPLYTKWEQMPELLLYRVKFMDLNLGTVILSNIGIISKENYKYLVKTYPAADKTEFKIELNNIQNMNFIDKVTCVIKRDNEDQKNISFNSTPKIIYKPVFYRTQDLQHIKIQTGVTQNIGVNLLNYLHTVETFFITIDNKQFIEIGRNDVYVIFSVQANLLTANGGSYHISNQDNEYISSGSWSLI